MSENLPDYNADNVTIGQCKILMDPYSTPTGAGATPTTDAGAIDEASISISRELLDMKQGTPQLMVQQWAIDEAGQLAVKGWEWNVKNMYKALSAGTTNISGRVETFDFGGEMIVRPLQIRLEHITPVGATIWLDFWRCSGAGALEYQFNPTDFNKFDYTFNLWKGTANWIGGVLAVGTRLFKYTRTNPPS